jgi:hypothetical protein
MSELKTMGGLGPAGPIREIERRASCKQAGRSEKKPRRGDAGFAFDLAGADFVIRSLMLLIHFTGRAA